MSAMDLGTGSTGELILSMETDLRLLRGVQAALQAFATSRDPVDPLALHVLARSGDEALERLNQLWNELYEGSQRGITSGPKERRSSKA